MRKIILTLVVFMLCFASVEATTVKLDKDTELHPQGWFAGSLTFKGGTDVVLNDRGEAVSGVLQNYARLNISGIGLEVTMSSFISDPASPPNLLCFKKGMPIAFNERGEVVAGTLQEDGIISLSGTFNDYVGFKYGTAISFHPNKYVASGTIKSNTYFRPTGWENGPKENAGFVKYKAGTELTFSDKGEVVTAKAPPEQN